MARDVIIGFFGSFRSQYRFMWHSVVNKFGRAKPRVANITVTSFGHYHDVRNVDWSSKWCHASADWRHLIPTIIITVFVLCYPLRLSRRCFYPAYISNGCFAARNMFVVHRTWPTMSESQVPRVRASTGSTFRVYDTFSTDDIVKCDFGDPFHIQDT